MGTLANDAATQAEAKAVYARHRSDSNAVDPNVLSAIIPIVAYTGGRAEYDEFFQAFKTAKTPQAEQRYLSALTGFRQPAEIQRALAMTVNGDARTQDAPFLVRQLLASVHSRELAWSFVKENWETMARQYPLTGLRRAYEGVTALATPEWETEVKEFFDSHQIKLGGKTLEQYLEQLRIAVVFRERERASLATYLSRRGAKA